MSGCKICKQHVSTAPTGCTLRYCKCGACNHCHPGGICPKKTTKIPGETEYWYKNASKSGDREVFDWSQSAGRWSVGWFADCTNDHTSLTAHAHTPTPTHIPCKYGATCYRTGNSDHMAKYTHPVVAFVASAVSAASDASAAGSQPQCTNCDAAVRGAGRFCSNCGIRL